MDKIGIPSVSGMKTALTGATVGAAGGALFALSQRMFGTGIWGGLAGIALAGSAVKGSAGEAISTVLGFQIGQSLLASMGSGKTVTTSLSEGFQAI